MSALLEACAAGWWGWIAPLSVQFAALALAVALVERCAGRRMPTAVRAALVWALLARLALPPGFSSPVGIVAAVGAGLPASEIAGTPGGGWTAVLFALWSAGVLVVLSSAIRRLVREHRAWSARVRPAGRALTQLSRSLSRSMSRSMSSGLARERWFAPVPEILLTDAALGPATIGILRPRIVLPAALAAEGQSARLRHVLLHELAHAARRDVLAALAWEAARVLFWFHPCVHLAARHASTLREIACDERAARASGAAAYRGSLLDAARDLLRSDAAPLAGFVPAQAQILSRLEALDRPVSRHERRDRAAGVLCFVAALIGCVPLAAHPSIDPGARPAAPYALDELQGCLRKRYAVLAAISASEAESSFRPSPTHTTQP